MSATTQAAPRAPLLGGGLLSGLCGLVLFAAVADKLFASGHLDPLLQTVWLASEDPAAVAGQWSVAVLLALVRRVPDAGPQTLVLLTTLAGALTLGMVWRRLRRIGWSVPEAAAAVALLALHPAVLMLASTGQTLLLSTMLVGVVVLSLDRVAVVGDAQSLMGLGLALAALVVTAPEALYIALPMVAVLPLCLRDVRDSGSAVALFMLTLFPSLIAVGGILLSAATFGEAPAYAVNRWLAPMHGVVEAANTPWLVENGGQFLAPLLRLSLLCLVTVPLMLLPVIALVIRPTERQRPATAMLAMMGGPVAGAGATLFWHSAGALAAVATCLAAVVSWISSRPLEPEERWLCLAWLLVGLLLSWGTGLFWADPAAASWRAALFG